MGGGRSHNDCDKFPGGEKSESLDELLKEAGEEAELVLENGLTSSLAKKKDGQSDDHGDGDEVIRGVVKYIYF